MQLQQDRMLRAKKERDDFHSRMGQNMSKFWSNIQIDYSFLYVWNCIKVIDKNHDKLIRIYSQPYQDICEFHTVLWFVLAVRCLHLFFLTNEIFLFTQQTKNKGNALAIDKSPNDVEIDKYQTCTHQKVKRWFTTTINFGPFESEQKQERNFRAGSYLLRLRPVTNEKR